MPLTKAEFDKWKACRDGAVAALKDRPIEKAAWIDIDGDLIVNSNTLSPTETRALYEMLKSWYGEDAPSPALSEAARSLLAAAVVVAVQGSIVKRDEWDRFVHAADAYRAEITR